MIFLLLFIFVPPLIFTYALMIFGGNSIRRICSSPPAVLPLTSACLAPFVLVFWGVVMRYAGPMGSEPRWPLDVLLGLDALVLVFYAYLVWSYVGVRLFVMGFVSVAVWFCFWADLFAICRLTND